jgi:hypothetical protein
MVAALARPKFVLAVVGLVRSDRLLVFWAAPATVGLAEMMFSTLVVEARVGVEADVLVPPRSPASVIMPGVVVVALDTEPLLVTVAQLVVVLLVACRTWPVEGLLLGKVIPFTLATVGLGKVPDRSPPTVSPGCRAVLAEVRLVCTELDRLVAGMLPARSV